MERAPLIHANELGMDWDGFGKRAEKVSSLGFFLKFLPLPFLQ